MIGLKVVCVKKGTFQYKGLDYKLKIGDHYTVEDIDYSTHQNGYFKKDKPQKISKYYIVTSSDTDVIYPGNEKVGWIPENYFKPLSEIREEKLKQLGL